jgi:hypothetical protein
VITDTGVVYGIAGKPLKPWLNQPTTYAHYALRLGGRKRYIHDLVLETFVGPKPPGACVRHLNGNSRDNRLENICYGTYSENMYDRVAHGNHPHAGKTHCKRGHEFTPENTYVIPASGSRQCLTCRRLIQRPKYNAKRRAARRGLVTGATNEITNTPTGVQP